MTKRMTEYFISDPGDEQGAIFDYFNYHPSAAQIRGAYGVWDHVDETDEE